MINNTLNSLWNYKGQIALGMGAVAAYQFGGAYLAGAYAIIALAANYFFYSSNPQQNDSPEITYGTHNQYNIKKEEQKNTVSSCTACAVQSLIVLKTHLSQGMPITSETIDKEILTNVISKQKQIILKTNVQVGVNNYTLNEVLQSKQFPTANEKETYIGSAPTVDPNKNYKDKIQTIINEQMGPDGFVHIVFVKGAASYSITIHQKTDKKQEFYFFDSHGDDRDPQKRAYVHSFDSIDTFSAFLAEKFPGFNDPEYDQYEMNCLAIQHTQSDSKIGR